MKEIEELVAAKTPEIPLFHKIANDMQTLIDTNEKFINVIHEKLARIAPVDELPSKGPKETRERVSNDSFKYSMRTMFEKMVAQKDDLEYIVHWLSEIVG